MSLLSSIFGSAKKTNLTPSITPQMPSQINPEMYGGLSQLAKQRIGAGTTGAETPGVGFGPDFVNQASNPIAASMRRNFQNVTSPNIQNQYAGKGTGYSSLAASAQALGQGNVESDIGNMMANFYQLNEQQKKNDISQGIGVGQGLLSGDVAQQNNMASASERLANATAAQNNYAQQVDQQRMGNILQGAGQIAAPILGGMSGMGGPIGGALNTLQSSIGGASGIRSNTLGSNSTDELIRLLQGLR